ncbi:MAG: NrsF family protein [Gammaproteobacteria bacterium]|nr:NrsF family protein [Gammaproteobacteria bacterium]
MNTGRRRLIAELSADLTPIRDAGKTLRKSCIWLCAASATAFLIIYATGPFRSGSLAQLHQNPQFLVETLLGIAAIAALGFTAFRTGIPVDVPITKRVSISIVLLCLWVALVAYGLVSPALEESMAGKREHCYLEALLYGLPGLMVGLMAIRRLYPLYGAWSGALLGLSAGAMPALIMQFACMYVPLHIITHHLLPGMALAIVGLIAGHFLLRPR